MTDVFTLWFGRFLTGAHAKAAAPSSEPTPMKIEVERLPDYLWRDLGFPLPKRPQDQ